MEDIEHKKQKTFQTQENALNVLSDEETTLREKSDSLTNDYNSQLMKQNTIIN